MAIYSDLNYLKPEKGDILYDIQVIYQSIYSLLQTKKGTRLFRPEWGGNLSRYLFEPCDELTARSMFQDIVNTIKAEERIELDTTNSTVVADPTNRRFIITLVFMIKGLGQTKTITLDFKQ